VNIKKHLHYLIEAESRHVCLYICMSVCVYFCICIYICGDVKIYRIHNIIEAGMKDMDGVSASCE